MAFSSDANNHTQRPHDESSIDVPTSMSRDWGRMMVGTASASIGLVQLILGIWIGGFFSVTLAGGLWCGVALQRKRAHLEPDQDATEPLGLCVWQTLLLASAGMLGLLILFY